MLLNYQQNTPEKGRKNIIFIHGLFGSLSNLAMLARHFEKNYNIIQIDVRNHGLSAHDSEMNYQCMAEDILHTLDYLQIDECILVGHSMGGKIAMNVANLAPNRIEHLIVLDMSPIRYSHREHENIFKALFAVEKMQANTRQSASEIMQKFIQQPMVIQFLLKSFTAEGWRFNLDALFLNYDKILSWKDITANDVSCLFLRGEHSAYVQSEQQIQAIDLQFTQAQLKTIDGAGHWLHAEKTTAVIQAIEEFLA